MTKIKEIKPRDTLIDELIKKVIDYGKLSIGWDMSGTGVPPDKEIIEQCCIWLNMFKLHYNLPIPHVSCSSSDNEIAMEWRNKHTGGFCYLLFRNKYIVNMSCDYTGERYLEKFDYIEDDITECTEDPLHQELMNMLFNKIKIMSYPKIKEEE